MFILVAFRDTVRINPKDFRLEPQKAIALELNKKFANKVVRDVGLCICLFDILSIAEGYIYPGDGCSNQEGFDEDKYFSRPFIGEILEGVIMRSDNTGVHVSLGFFQDIVLPPHLLHEPSSFLEEEQTWIWSAQGQTFYFDEGEPIRFRVAREEFNDNTPKEPPKMESEVETVEISRRPAPYLITGSAYETGTGVVRWWES